MTFSTDQENFWAGEFSTGYLQRNQGESLIFSNINLFSKILKNTAGVSTIAEFGCNIGLNLQALNRINKTYQMRGYEINQQAASVATDLNIAEIAK